MIRKYKRYQNNYDLMSELTEPEILGQTRCMYLVNVDTRQIIFWGRGNFKECREAARVNNSNVVAVGEYGPELIYVSQNKVPFLTAHERDLNE